jgi:hypothetical protein
MKPILPIFGIVVFLILGLLSPVSAQMQTLKPNQAIVEQPNREQPAAADSQIGDICTRRAKDAVGQNRINQELGCGFKGGQWSGDFQSHFKRCQKIGAREEMRNYKKRLNELNACRDRNKAQAPKSTNPAPGNTGYGTREKKPSANQSMRDYCQRYASAAVKAQKDNKRLKCGYWGPAWHTRLSHHFHWCLDQSRTKSTRHTQKRDFELLACRKKIASKKIHWAYCRPGGGMRISTAFSNWAVLDKVKFKKAPGTKGRKLLPGECKLDGADFFEPSDDVFFQFLPPPGGLPAYEVFYDKDGFGIYRPGSGMGRDLYELAMHAWKTGRIFKIQVKYDPEGRRDWKVLQVSRETLAPE